MPPPNLRPLPALAPDVLPVIPGSRLAGRYRVLHHLDAPASGLVVMALDESENSRLIIKLLAPVRGPNPEEPFGERTLRRAARKAARVRHPGLVVVHDVFVERLGDADVVGVVMDRCAAPRLDRLVAEKGAIPWLEAVDLLDAVASALQAAHAHGVLHLGARPSKVYVDPQQPDTPRSAVLVGLGLLAAQRELRRPGRVPGDPRWLAPEVLDDGPVDGRADVWSLGRLMEVLLTGDAEGKSPIAVVDQDLPEALVRLVRSSLDAEPGRRPASVEVFRRELARLVDPAAETPAMLVPAPPPKKRRSVWPLVGALMVGGALVGVSLGVAYAVVAGWIQLGSPTSAEVVPSVARVVVGDPIPLEREAPPAPEPPLTVPAAARPAAPAPPADLAPVVAAPPPAPVVVPPGSILPDPPPSPTPLPPVPKPKPKPKLYGSLTSADAAVGLVYEQAGRVNGGDCLKLTVRNLGEAPLERWSIDLAVPEPVRLTGATGFSPFGEGPVRLVPDVGTLGPLEAYSGTLCATPLLRPAGLSWRVAGPG